MLPQTQTSVAQFGPVLTYATSAIYGAQKWISWFYCCGVGARNSPISCQQEAVSFIMLGIIENTAVHRRR
jgi:hypothetical protein